MAGQVFVWPFLVRFRTSGECSVSEKQASLFPNPAIALGSEACLGYSSVDELILVVTLLSGQAQAPNNVKPRAFRGTG